MVYAVMSAGSSFRVRSIRTAARGLFSKHGVKVEPQDFPDPALMPAAIAGGHQEREHERRQC